MAKGNSTRHGKLELSTKVDGKREKKEFGAIFSGNFQGNYGVSLTIPRVDKDGNVVIGDNGYPEREKIVAVKGEHGQKVSLRDCFINFICYEAMEARPPYDGPGAENNNSNDAPAASKEDFGDDDF